MVKKQDFKKNIFNSTPLLDNSETSKSKEQRWEKREAGIVVSNKEKILLAKEVNLIAKNRVEKEYFNNFKIWQDGQRMIESLFNKGSITKKEKQKLEDLYYNLFDLLVKKTNQEPEKKLKSEQLERVQNIAIRTEQVEYQDAMAKVTSLAELKTVVNQYGKIKGSQQIFEVPMLKKIIGIISKDNTKISAATSALGFRDALRRILNQKPKNNSIE